MLLLPGRTGGALEFRKALQKAGCRADVLLGEANTFPFASRAVGPARMRPRPRFPPRGPVYSQPDRSSQGADWPSGSASARRAISIPERSLAW